MVTHLRKALDRSWTCSEMLKRFTTCHRWNRGWGCPPTTHKLIKRFTNCTESIINEIAKKLAYLRPRATQCMGHHRLAATSLKHPDGLTSLTVANLAMERKFGDLSHWDNGESFRFTSV